MNKLKRWIIYKLGGMLFEDLPKEAQIIVVKYMAEKTINENIKKILL